jgi:hypothetical protein
MFAEGSHEDLFIVENKPAREGWGNDVTWEQISGKRVKWVFQYDNWDRSYFVGIEGLPKDIWIPEEWIVRAVDGEYFRRAWRAEQLSESARQMAYAAAFQRLMWRELLGSAAKKQVGDSVTVKGCARTIERAFPGAWVSEHYAFCWGKAGKIVAELREMGEDGELHRMYHLSFTFPPGSDFCDMNIWFAGEDLE